MECIAKVVSANGAGFRQGGIFGLHLFGLSGQFFVHKVFVLFEHLSSVNHILNFLLMVADVLFQKLKQPKYIFI